MPAFAGSTGQNCALREICMQAVLPAPLAQALVLSEVEFAGLWAGGRVSLYCVVGRITSVYKVCLCSPAKLLIINAVVPFPTPYSLLYTVDLFMLSASLPAGTYLANLWPCIVLKVTHVSGIRYLLLNSCHALCHTLPAFLGFVCMTTWCCFFIAVFSLRAGLGQTI